MSDPAVPSGFRPARCQWGTSSMPHLRPASNYQRPNSLLFSAPLAQECRFDTFLESCSYLSVPGEHGSARHSRLCLLSLKLRFILGQKAAISDFSFSIDFAKHTAHPPTVQGFRFMFTASSALESHLKRCLLESPSHLGSDWYTQGYDSLYTGPGDLPYKFGDHHTYFWAERRQSPSLTIRSDGFPGSANGTVEDVSISILLSFPSSISRLLLSDCHVTCLVNSLSERSGRVVQEHFTSKHALPNLRIAYGPELEICPGDPSFHLPLPRINRLNRKAEVASKIKLGRKRVRFALPHQHESPERSRAIPYIRGF